MSIKDVLNFHLNRNSCPGQKPGYIGECAATDVRYHFHDGSTGYEGYIYLHDESFTDSTELAKWVLEAGGTRVWVQSVLYSDCNGDRDGRTADGIRAWIVNWVEPPGGLPEIGPAEAEHGR
jgi:hypothetical protein